MSPVAVTVPTISNVATGISLFTPTFPSFPTLKAVDLLPFAVPLPTANK